MEKDEETRFILLLIANVEQKKCLYDKRNAFYFNKNVRERAWMEIAKICGKSCADCKHRWKLLRERFCKELKRMKAPSGSGISYLEEWRFMQPMRFLKGSLAPRRTRDNILEQNTDSALDQSILSLCEKFGKTIENIEKSTSSSTNQGSADEAFMRTVVCLMKDLPVAVKDDFQAGIMQELYRLRKEYRNV